MTNTLITALATRRILARVAAAGLLFVVPGWRAPGIPRFVELPCSELWGSFAGVPAGVVRCGTVTVPQDRAAPNDSQLTPVVLPVVVYAAPGARGTPLVFFTGGPGESSIQAVQDVFLKSPLGAMALRERPIVAIERRGYSPVARRASPDLGTVVFVPRAKRETAVAPLRDSLVRRARELRAQGVELRNFTTMAVVDDAADVLRALDYPKVVLFGVSYGSREVLQFMRRYPTMVDAAVLDGVAPPSAVQLLDATYVGESGREVVRRVIADCVADPECAAQYADLTQSAENLGHDAAGLRHTAHFSEEGWQSLDVTGLSLLTVLGVAASVEQVRANVPQMIVDFARHDSLSDDLSARVLVAAAIDPALQITTREASPLVYYIALCGDRPQGEPRAGDRRLCDALDVPFEGKELVTPVTSDAPTLLISSGYDAQTPAQLADEAAKTLPRAQRVNFPMTGHVAFQRPMVAPCAAILIETFLRNPDYPISSECAGAIVPGFAPRSSEAAKYSRSSSISPPRK